MPLTTIHSYLPTIDAFLQLWSDINAGLGGGPATDLKLPGSYTRANLVSDRAAIAAAFAEVAAADSVRENAKGALDLAKAAIKPKLLLYRSAVRAALKGTSHVHGIPRAPYLKANHDKFTAPLHEMRQDWDVINTSTIPGFTGPLLVGTTTLAAFTTELNALESLYTAYTNARNVSANTREQRDALLPPVKAHLRDFRDAATARLGLNHPLVNAIPSLAPPPGSTPNPVAAAGSWSADADEAVITWQPSDNPNLAYYSIRQAPGPVYKAAEETVIGQVPAGTHTFSTLSGLAAPGAEALYRIYVVLTTGNEKGSATVKVVRPEV